MVAHEVVLFAVRREPVDQSEVSIVASCGPIRGEFCDRSCEYCGQRTNGSSPVGLIKVRPLPGGLLAECDHVLSEHDAGHGVVERRQRGGAQQELSVDGVCHQLEPVHCRGLVYIRVAIERGVLGPVAGLHILHYVEAARGERGPQRLQAQQLVRGQVRAVIYDHRQVAPSLQPITGLVLLSTNQGSALLSTNQGSALLSTNHSSPGV